MIMKFETPANPNYCATVVRIRNIILLPNCDNVAANDEFIQSLNQLL